MGGRGDCLKLYVCVTVSEYMCEGHKDRRVHWPQGVGVYEHDRVCDRWDSGWYDEGKGDGLKTTQLYQTTWVAVSAGPHRVGSQ